MKLLQIKFMVLVAGFLHNILQELRANNHRPYDEHANEAIKLFLVDCKNEDVHL